MYLGYALFSVCKLYLNKMPGKNEEGTYPFGIKVF